MSWQGYVDTLMATKSLTACGVFGHDGSVWAASQGFPLGADAIKQIVASTVDSSKVANGVTMGADKYILLRSDPGVSVILKKALNGIVAYRSAQSCIIGIHDHTVKTEIALTHVGKVIDHLTRHGY
ncbi:unnamed protein product [Brachionus calyciflorus]|uniref:Profilin n=1 Tax=Brachionus calyciflorus TaxID=104777 RepID=A0A814CUR4_9BILA|nr:unnamed protein product [Brachionus calyciflorus]